MSNRKERGGVLFSVLLTAVVFFSVSAWASDLEAENLRREQIQKSAEALRVVPPEAGLVRAPQGLLKDALDVDQPQPAEEKVEALQREVLRLKSQISVVRAMTQEKISTLEYLVRYMQSVVEYNRELARYHELPLNSPEEEKVLRLEAKAQYLRAQISQAKTETKNKIDNLEHLTQALREVLNYDRAQAGKSAAPAAL